MVEGDHIEFIDAWIVSPDGRLLVKDLNLKVCTFLHPMLHLQTFVALLLFRPFFSVCLCMLLMCMLCTGASWLQHHDHWPQRLRQEQHVQSYW